MENVPKSIGGTRSHGLEELANPRYLEGSRAVSDTCLPASDRRPLRVSRRAAKLAVERQLQAEVDVFLRRWGSTQWRSELQGVRPIADGPVLRLVRAVAAIEDDAFYIQVKLRHAGILRSPAIQQFNAVWLAEETDHGRAFEALAQRLSDGEPSELVRHNTFARDPRAAIAIPVMRLLSRHRTAALATYLVRGAMVEHVAIAGYGALLRQLRSEREDAGAEIVRQILVQEGRHLRFFSRGAKAVLEPSPSTARLVRRVVDASWRPPGVDLYGARRWKELFTPVLSEREAFDDLMAIDKKMDAIYGHDGSQTVQRYLSALRSTNHHVHRPWPC